ncbi:hypothetical protein [Pelagicoccus sp. SDUM812005]|uniref:hypothetical protein n=1 Tax=Pelagicoccus sp. SDUM812005 TaxID=3041257 RepID=UPI00280F0DAE|nr:hypothetical protein [Pelagicoccus sp. SDUM812005]MDQ8182054.1 hypothetical protein [Pelagicoccus sp. SDUM812005]
MLPFRIFALIASLLLGGVASLASVREPTEGPPILFARDVAPQVKLRTEAYTVSPMVEVREFAYTFRVTSTYGNFQVRGVPQLETLLHELEVIRKLAEVSQSEAFASSLSSSLTSPVATTVGVAKRPVAAVTGLPGGVVRYLGGKLYQVRRGSDKALESYREYRSKDDKEEPEPTVEEPKGKKKKLVSSAGKLSRKHLGHDSAKRRWARQLGVDPYSKNEVLQEALGRIAWASSLGGFAGDFAVPSSEVFSYAGKARELVWDRPAHQLEREIVDTLKDLGLEKGLIHEFRDTPIYSLTEKMELCFGFKSLKDSGDIAFLVDFALRAENDEDAELMIRTLEVLVSYSERVARIATIGERRGMLYACSDRGYDIYPLAVDYLHWTPLVYEALLSEELMAEKREIWVSGQVSPIAKLQLREHGWLVFEQVDRYGKSSNAATAKR